MGRIDGEPAGGAATEPSARGGRRMEDGRAVERGYRIAVVPGDGIGPEVVAEGVKVLEAALGRDRVRCAFLQVPGGAELYRRTGVSFPEESRRVCREADAVYFGATGLPDVQLPDGTGVSVAWELRKGMDLYAGVRPIRLFNGGLSPLKGLEAGGIRFTVVRENSEGIYASRWAGTQLNDDVAVNPIVVTRKATERIMRVAFRLAEESPGAPADGRKRVTCVDKSNVLGAWAFFRRIYDEAAAAHPTVQKDYAYIDAVTLLLVREPGRYDIVVTENQHGDVLSDLGAALVGGLGFAPSGNIGDRQAMFEPAHGTAPGIAGKGIANPVAAILSGAMMLRWLGGQHGEARLAAAAERVERATEAVLAEGRVLTADAGGTASTAMMGDAIADRLARL